MRRGFGLVAAAAMLVAGTPAWAVCSASNQYNFVYNSLPTQSLSYSGTYNYTATNGLGQSVGFTMSMAQNGLSSTTVAGQAMPAISTLVNGTTGGRNLVLGGIFSGRTADIASNTRTVRVTYTFAQPIRDFTIIVHDIDYTNNQFRDWIRVIGQRGGSTYTPVLTTPHGTGNTGGLPTTSGNSSILIGNGANGFSAQQARGVSGSDNNNSDTGTITASFAEPVTSVVFSYGNYPLSFGENSTGQQGIGIERVTFCPMPNVSVTKASTPVAGPLGAFNLPENDVIYTITVTNNGGSPVDANSLILEDGLPSGITFRNTAFDGTTSLPFKVTGASGVTLSAAGISYSQTGNASFGYTPAAGYDAQVDAFRVVPSGELPANSSVSVQFRGRIN